MYAIREGRTSTIGATFSMTPNSGSMPTPAPTNFGAMSEVMPENFEIKLNSRNKPMTCKFLGEFFLHEIPVELSEEHDTIESFSIRWLPDRICVCEVSSNFTNTSKLINTTVGQTHEMRWINLLFSKKHRGIPKTESVITIENSYDDPATYGSFVGETTVNISFVRQE